MVHHLFAKSIEGLHHDLINGYQRTKEFPSAVSGREREIFIEQLLSRILPPGFRFGSGVIIDSTGANETGQIDLIIERPHSASLPVGISNQRLYAAETVAAAFEVKSNLSKQWGDVEETWGRLEAMRVLGEPEFYKEDGGQYFGHTFDHFVPMFMVGFSGYSSLDGLSKRLGMWGKRPSFRGAFIVDSGVFIGRSGSHGRQTKNVEAEGPRGLAAFISILLDTILANPHRNPRFGEYI